MRTKKHLGFVTLLSVALSGISFAYDHDHDHGHHQHRQDDDDRDHGHRQHRQDEDDRGAHYYREHDRGEMREWYREHGNDLPPGLAKRDRLPPGLERQLRVRGTLPPGLRTQMRPCPEELERRLPPPPRGCAHVIVGGHVVLVNRASYVVLDIFHFEL